jgi:hypothetical protein
VSRALRVVAVLAAGAAVLALAGCGGAVRIAYNNGDLALRFLADDYLDLHGEQQEVLKAQLARLHVWHRRQELPQYASLFSGAAGRVEKGLTRADVEWALAAVRARYRTLVEQAADEAAPLVASLGPDNFRALEKKLAASNEKFAKEYLSGDAAKQARAREKRLSGMLEDWLGDLTAEQEAMIARFVLEQPQLNRIRLEDRRRRQAEFVALLREHRRSADLTARLRDFFVNWERDRGAEHRRLAQEWENRLVTLIVAVDDSLTPRQRRHFVQRLDAFAEDARVLAQQGRPAGITAGVSGGATVAAQ